MMDDEAWYCDICRITHIGNRARHGEYGGTRNPRPQLDAEYLALLADLDEIIREVGEGHETPLPIFRSLRAWRARLIGWMES